MGAAATRHNATGLTLTTLAATLLAAFAAAPAAAQQAGPSSTPPTPPTPAASAPAAEPPLPVIVVTGEKTARLLSATASSVRVFNANELGSDPGLLGTNGLLASVANITATGVQNLAPAVRGVDGTGPAQGADAFLGGTRPRLNMLVDGRTASYNEVVFGDLGLWDLDQVEVFRGTQSLLQGRNSIAGNIVYKTNDPTFTPEYGGRVIVGSHEMRGVAAAVSMPLNGDWAFRVALDQQRSQSTSNGYAAYEGVDDPGEFESTMARIKLLYEPKSTPGLRSLLTVAHNEHHGPQSEDVNRTFGDRVISYPPMPVFAPRATSAVWDLDWRLNEQLKLESRVVAGDVRIRRKAMPGDGNAVMDGHDFAIEPRLRYQSAGGGFDGFVGVYAFDAEQHDTIDLFGGGAWDDKTRTYAVYGEGTWALRPDVDLVVGGRYEQERRYRQGTLAFFVTDLDETYRVFLPKLGLAWKLSPQTTLGAALSRGYNGGGAAFTFDEPYVNYSYTPEYVWNLEAYARSLQLGGKLQLNANLFYSRYKDMQQPFDLNPDPAIWAYVVRNAPRASTHGAELGAEWAATPALRLSAELGLLKAQIDEYPGSGVQGNALPRAPATSLTLGAQWRGRGGLELGAGAHYSSAYYSDITNVERGRVSPGWTANVRAACPMGPVRLFAFVNNLFDTKRPLLLNADPGSSDNSTDTATLPQPRTVAVGLEAWF